ncbi:MAG TPA: hypothetical protein VN815_09830 [Steroidobacteraceae bacterium]|jgi:hypothetical protein|nr:hypothetical protein [Steroidobacteraceae bacterium]
MKSALIFALSLMTLMGEVTVAAAEKANFSGEWKMNAAKSNFGQLPPPASFVRKIQHKDPSLTIIEEQNANGMQSTTTRAVTTDGKPTTLQLNGIAALCSAVWDGSDIVASTAMDAAGLKFTDRMSLSADGKTLTSKVKIGSPQGDAEITIVFDRQ